MKEQIRDYVKHPCKYLGYECINEEYDREWKCKRGYGLCPICDRCKEYEEGDKE